MPGVRANHRQGESIYRKWTPITGPHLVFAVPHDVDGHGSLRKPRQQLLAPLVPQRGGTNYQKWPALGVARRQRDGLRTATAERRSARLPSTVGSSAQRIATAERRSARLPSTVGSCSQRPSRTSGQELAEQTGMRLRYTSVTKSRSVAFLPTCTVFLSPISRPRAAGPPPILAH
eukprot:1180628-Prorocentrum_minimum.AAC.2